MAKYELRIKARELRAKGESVKDISEKLGVSKGTASIWVRDIVLSVEDLEKLRQKMIKGSERGRLRGAFLQKQRRLDLLKKHRIEGRERFKKLSDEEFFAAGIALYWAEGSKKQNSFYFCNSDPILINFMINWLKKFFSIENEHLKLTVGINEVHKNRDDAVKKYWSKTTGISLDRFRQSSFKKSKPKKIYANHNDYYGTLGVTVLKGTELCYKILGLIDGLASQRSSVGRAAES